MTIIRAMLSGSHPLSLSLNDNESTFQRILKSPVDMTIIRAMLSGSE